MKIRHIFTQKKIQSFFPIETEKKYAFLTPKIISFQPQSNAAGDQQQGRPGHCREPAQHRDRGEGVPPLIPVNV